MNKKTSCKGCFFILVRLIFLDDKHGWLVKLLFKLVEPFQIISQAEGLTAFEAEGICG